MTRRTRRLLFYLAVVIFLFLSLVVVIYARGYKYSFDDNRFVRTGAVRLDVNTGANVYFNDKFVGTTSFLGNSFSRGGLLPGQYSVRISKENYTTWQKKVFVQEGFLTEFTKIIILPENEDERGKLITEIEDLLYPSSSPSSSISPSLTPKVKISASPTPTPETREPFYIKSKKLYSNANQTEPEVISDNVLGFVLSPNESKLFWWNSNNEIWVLWLKDSGYQPYHKKGDKELITRFSTKVKQAAWFKGEDHVVVDSLGYKIVETDTRGGIN